MQHLDAAVLVVSHDDAPIAVDSDAALRIIELTITCATAADRADMGSISIIQHLHAMIAIFNHNQLPRAVQRDTHRSIELAVACAPLADGPQVLPVAVP